MAQDFVEGGDYLIQITAEDSAGTVIDLTTLNGYIFVIYYADGEVVQQYSRETVNGFKSLVLTDEVNGIFSVRLQSTDTTGVRFEKIFGEVKLESPDVNFDNSIKHDPQTNIKLGQFVKSQTEQYTVLT